MGCSLRASVWACPGSASAEAGMREAVVGFDRLRDGGLSPIQVPLFVFAMCVRDSSLVDVLSVGFRPVRTGCVFNAMRTSEGRTR